MSTATVSPAEAASAGAAPAAARGKVTQLRVIKSEWIKVRTLRWHLI